MALTVKGIEKLSKPGRYHDGFGLYLEVAPTSPKGVPGARSWTFRYERADSRPGREGKRRERWMWLGSLDAFDLKEARERARKARQMLTDGIDPLDAQEAERTRQKEIAAKAKLNAITFKQVAMSYYDLNSNSWSEKVRVRFTSTLRDYAYPVFGDDPVSSITTSKVHDVLAPIWTTKHPTAKKLRGNIEGVIDYAKAKDYFTGENPATINGKLKQLLGKHTHIENHQPSLSYKQIHDFLTELASHEGFAAKALEFMILTPHSPDDAII